MDEIKLKPCPFCGREPFLIRTVCLKSNAVSYHVFHGTAHCPISGISTSNALTAEDAVEIWNRRANNG